MVRTTRTECVPADRLAGRTRMQSPWIVNSGPPGAPSNDTDVSAGESPRKLLPVIVRTPPAVRAAGVTASMTGGCEGSAVTVRYRTGRLDVKDWVPWMTTTETR